MGAAGQGRDIERVELPPRKAGQPPGSESLEGGGQPLTSSVGQQADRPQAERLKEFSPVIDVLARTTLSIWRKSTWSAPYRPGATTRPGSKTAACVTFRYRGNPGGPALSSMEGSTPYDLNKEGKRTERWESDGLVVPVKAGNAAGGKEATRGTAA